MKKALEAGKFEPFIRSIRFPYLKNISPGLEISFTHPITIITGPNGTNKSTILRALQGCPVENDLGNYWFETELDRIESSQPQRYVHTYRLPSGSLAEVIKTRVWRSDREGEYFETRAPTVRDGMQRMPVDTNPLDSPYRNATRWRPIEKPVLYLDFRSELSAFDIFYHFHDVDATRASSRVERKELLERKQRVRVRAKRIAKAMAGSEGQSDVYYGSERIIEDGALLEPREMEEVARILGREFDEIKLLRHRYFNVDGYTARLKSPHINYSEAYAGSGEFATVMLVRKICQAPERSLILLDEPETSLHPAAQVRLIEFIAREALEAKHQVIIATHSQAIAGALHSDSIRVLNYISENGRVELMATSSTPAEAFFQIGALDSRQRVYVEDKLAREFVLHAARTKSEALASALEVVALPGGWNDIMTRIVPLLAQGDIPGTVLLDGDARIDPPLRESAKVPDHELWSELARAGVRKKDIFSDGDDGRAMAHGRKILDWICANVRYLPGVGNPEALLMEATGLQPLENSAAKKYWCEKAARELKPILGEVSSADIFTVQRMALAGMSADSQVYEAIVDLLIGRGLSS